MLAYGDGSFASVCAMRSKRRSTSPPRRRQGRARLKPDTTTPNASPTSRDPRSAGARFARLVEIMRILRSPEGCPWDHEQTLDTLRAFVLEETYEVLDAIDRKDYAALRGEIGDLLLEGVFLAQVCADERRFTVAEALDAVIDKLIRRHPHIFPGGRHARRSTLRTAGEVRRQWEEVKARERAEAGERDDLLSGVPRALPALAQASALGKRVATVGFDWDRADDVLGKIEEEVAELRRAIAEEGPARTEEEMGDLLFALANLSRKLAIDPESALRRANDKFIERFRAVEARLRARGRSLHDATLEDMEAEWQKIKASGH